ncbi:hypothetical protein MTO96_029988 [Rhipicephalus appendiculatus]
MVIVKSQSGDRLAGLLGDVLDALSLSLRFNYSLQLAADRALGNVFPNGTATGLIGRLQRDEADVAMAMMVPSNERNRAARYTAPVYSDEITILAAVPTDSGASGSFRIPPGLRHDQLNGKCWQVWLCLMASLMVCCVFVAAADSERKAQGFLRRAAHHFFGLLSNLLQQGGGEEVRGQRYLAVRSLRVSSDRAVWRSVWRMVERHAGQVSIDELYRPAHLAQVASGRAVVLSDRTSFRYVVGRSCGRYPQAQFYVAREPINTLSFGLYVNARLDPRFRRALDQRPVSSVVPLGWLRESGLMGLWTERMLPDWGRCAQRQRSFQPLGLKDVHATLVSAALLGSVMPLVALMAEIRMGRRPAAADFAAGETQSLVEVAYSYIETRLTCDMRKVQHVACT